MSQASRQEVVYLEVVYLHASEDEVLRKKLAKSLTPMRLKGLINEWSKQDLLAGGETDKETLARVDAAHMLLVLISPDFIANCLAMPAVQRAQERWKAGEARLIPILLRPTILEDTLFAGVTKLPRNDKAVTEWSNQDLAFGDIALGIRKHIEEYWASNTNDVISPPTPTPRDDLRTRLKEPVDALLRTEKKVNELKTVHNLLHGIELQIEGFLTTIQLGLSLSQDTFDFQALEGSWWQVEQKLEELKYFAQFEMRYIENEHFSIEINGTHGPKWVRDLCPWEDVLKEEGLPRHNLQTIESLSRDLLNKCRSHLSSIDRRLATAVRELGEIADRIHRSVS